MANFREQMDSIVVVRNQATGENYTLAQVKTMRKELERTSGLDLADMSNKSVIVNFLTKKEAGVL